ncbi:MAG: hypothetical protein J0H14_19310 [Alphaproteobacteria bacterium]|nr:hypothetical protein [Alphaproteobacteria bacterium]
MSHALVQPNRPSPGRRRALRLLASLPAIGWAGSALARAPHGPQFAVASQATLFPAGASILVAGPDGGELDRWGRVLAPALARYLPQGPAIRVQSAGGADGVTGANQFDARTAPDGTTVLLVPGAAALAWLAGDPRAQFDAAHWVPVLTGMTPGIVAGRAGPATLARGNRLRIAAAGPGGPELAALLALQLLGAEPVPLFGLSEPAAIRNSFAHREVDLVFLAGPRVPDRLAALVPAGVQPLFSLGAFDAEGKPGRDPLFPDLPRTAELLGRQRGAPPADRLYDAYMATAAAARLDFGLMLPQLTPASMVALWRRAAAQAVGSPELQAAADAASVRPLSGAGAAASTSAVAADAGTLLDLRHWLATRFNWRPG